MEQGVVSLSVFEQHWLPSNVVVVAVLLPALVVVVTVRTAEEMVVAGT